MRHYSVVASLCCAAAGSVLLASPGLAAVAIRTLEVANAQNVLVNGLSADGSTIVGGAYLPLGASSFGYKPIYWDQSGPHQLSPVSPGTIGALAAVTADGIGMSGFTGNSGDTGASAALWTAPSPTGQKLGTFGRNVNNITWAMSGDGSVVVGTNHDAAGQNSQAFRWTQASGMVLIGSLPLTPPLDQSVVPRAVSYNGSITVGTSGTAPVRWVGTTQQTLPLPAGGTGTAVDVSADGGTILGYYQAPAVPRTGCLWLPGDILVPLAAPIGYSQIAPIAMSDDAQTIIARAGSPTPTFFVWANGPAAQPVTLTDYLSMHGFDVSGWTNFQPKAISADGLTIAGTGQHGGPVIGWVATIPAPMTSAMCVLVGVTFRRRRRLD